jgi:phage FluMu gp28-like protein
LVEQLDNIAALAGPEPAVNAGPIVRFDPSQKRFFEDDARVIAVNWHRQKGKDFVAAAKAVKTGSANGKNWYIVSLTQRQADATHNKAEKFIELYKRVLKLKGRVLTSEAEFEEYDAEINHTFVRKERKLILPNKAEIVALPGKNPDTLAGLTGNIILTEFGLFPKGGYEHWRVIFPLTTRGFQAIPISTPPWQENQVL